MKVSKADDTLDVIFTVDVESNRGNIPYGIEGDLWEFGIRENCGINYIMDTFSAYDAKIVAFVNIYEHKRYDPKYMPSLLRRINERGHEVALHAHSGDFPFFKKKIASCSLEEQKKILSYGRQYISQAVGRCPVSFRAGAYSANDYIFEALRDTGFQIDSSVYYMHRKNQFKKYADRKNKIFCANGIIEFPIVVIWNETRWSKLDINWLTEDELIRAFELMRKSNMYHTVQCMFHSFSFFNGSEVFKAINSGRSIFCEERKSEKKKLETLLQFLRSSDKYRILTFEEYLKQNVMEPEDDVLDDVLYLDNRDMAYQYSDIEVLYDENVLTLVNHFTGDGIQYAWIISPEKRKEEMPTYRSGYHSNNAYRIELSEETDGKYVIWSYMGNSDGKRVGAGYYSVQVSRGKVLSIERRL